MKKRLFLFLTFLLLLLSINLIKTDAKGNNHHIIHEKYAKIVQANYNDYQLVLKLEVDQKVYSASFDYEITNDEYLFFHHNEGTYINITYYIKNNKLIITKWFE